MSFSSNPSLETRAPEDWLGTPSDENGRFVNLYHPFKPEFSKLLKWQTQKNPQKEIKKAEKWFPEVMHDGAFKTSKEN